jgi:alkanesulfonate monooxygenase SsuD/methylene tetrahydromethanopterin reductase-like flavin-dependent oxidoreductase (luciferase family)
MATGIVPAGKEVTRLREYLTVLRSIRDDGEVDFQGQELAARPPLSPVVAGGELADGTLTYLAGPRTIEEFIAITQAEGGSEHVNADDPTPPANSSPTGSPTG